MRDLQSQMLINTLLPLKSSSKHPLTSQLQNFFFFFSLFPVRNGVLTYGIVYHVQQCLVTGDGYIRLVMEYQPRCFDAACPTETNEMIWKFLVDKLDTRNYLREHKYDAVFSKRRECVKQKWKSAKWRISNMR